MAITYSAAVAAARLTVVRDAIDAGSGPGILEICTAAYAVVLAQVPFEDPCAPTPAAKVLTFDTTPALEDTAANNSGTAAIARIKDSNGTVICDGLTVATSAADIIVSTTAFVAGQPVRCSSAVITHP